MKNFEDFWYTPKRYDDKENCPRYKLKCLDGLEAAEFIGLWSINENGFYVFSPGAIVRMLNIGLIDWENILIDFDINQLGKIPGADLHAIAGELISNSFLVEDDVKN